MRHPRILVGAAALVCAHALVGAHACAQAVCAEIDYRDPECRVVAENEVARRRSASGVELRFQEPAARSSESWAALGVLDEPLPGVVSARIAALGDFAISIDPPAGATELSLILENVDPAAVVELEDGDARVPIPAEGAALYRRVTVTLDGDETRWIRGALPCAARYRLAVVGDIQTGVTHFERILDQLALEVEEAARADEPLLGLLLLGDLTEWSGYEEFLEVRALVDRAPTPIVVTPGNHDVYLARSDAYALQFGPGNIGFTVCGSRVALLDSGSGALARSIEARLPEFLERGDATHLIFGTHFPPHAGLTGDGWTREDQAHHLLAALREADAGLVLAGHIHALHHDPDVPVAGGSLSQVIVGTGGARQGVGPLRYGYLRLVIGDEIEPCFVEVPPPGASPGDDPTPGGVRRCAT